MIYVHRAEQDGVGQARPILIPSPLLGRESLSGTKQAKQGIFAIPRTQEIPRLLITTSICPT